MWCVKTDGHQWLANYLYKDPLGTTVLGVARCDHKCFRQFRPDPTGKMGRTWRLTLPDGTKAGAGIPYRLPEILDSDAMRNVYVVEGEKDADRLWSMEQPATCNAGGAGKWTPQHAEWLVGRDVMIVADRDDAGRSHAVHVAETLMDLASSIAILQASEGKDISDHLSAGGTLKTLVTIAEPKVLADLGVDA
jgi:5S rRNA maturation endonuclease (ribonuclease M5)